MDGATQLEDDPDQSQKKRATWSLALLAVAASAILLLATSPSLSIVWDEGFTLGREERIRQWTRALKDPAEFAKTWYRPTTRLEQMIPPDGERPPLATTADTRSKLLKWPALDWFWPFARQEPHGHPPFYALVGLAGDFLAPGWDVLTRARLGPILVFSLASGAIFWFFASRYETYWPALAAWSAWVLSPRFFAHAHYAHYDAILTSLWVGSILAFSMAVESRPSLTSRWQPRWRWVAVLGLLLGCALATKLTGWFIPLPLLAWVVLYRERRGVLTLLAAGALALLVAWLLVPPWWDNLIGGLDAFFKSNLTRSQTTRIPTLFLGQVYVTPQTALPWYNTLAWTLMVTPALFLFLAAGGIVRSLRWSRSERFGMLVLSNWAFLMALRALPFAPGHDGIRQFLPAFGVLALLVGLGAAEAFQRRKTLARWLISAAVVEAVVSLAVMMPVPLSYYSPLVGGLPGANRIGMEPTYYWDALTDDALDWLNNNTPPGQGLLFCTNPMSWLYLQETGKLKPPVVGLQKGQVIPAWYIVQNRPGMFSPMDRGLVDRLGPGHVLVEKLGVPLIWAFPHDEFERQQEIEAERHRLELRNRNNAP